METLKNSMARRIGAQLTFLPEDSRASHSVSPGKDSELMTPGISGRKCLESFMKFDRPTLLAKMFSASLIGQMGWCSKWCALTWRLKATKSHRLYFQLRV